MIQWQINTGSGFTNLADGNGFSGVNTDTLTITGATAGMNGDEFQCVFSNAANLSATTSVATLTVDYTPTVTTSPQSQSVHVGATVTFMAAATDGNPTPTMIQWQINTGSGFTNLTDGNGFSGVNTGTLTITSAAGVMNGDQFQCVFSNAANLSATTSSATLNVSSPPTVTKNPQSQKVAVGTMVTFTATATDGFPTPTTVQWEISKNGGTSFTPINGATSTTLSFTPVLAQNGDLFEAVFSNPDHLTATTTAATLSVVTPVKTTAKVSPVSITYGTALSNGQLSGTATAVQNGKTVSVPGTFTYAYTAGSVPLGGTYSLSVTFTPTDTAAFLSATTTVKVTVAKAAPQLTIPPITISYGAALSTALLQSATASATVNGQMVSVPGTFTFSAPPRTPLTVGTHMESVKFVPAESVDYQAVTTTVSITVVQATPTFSNVQLSSVALAKGTTVTLTGQISAGTVFPTGMVVITIVGGPSVQATIKANGTFTANLPTTSLSSGEDYLVDLAYAGNTNFAAAADVFVMFGVE